jgi:hypothetical protein
MLGHARLLAVAADRDRHAPGKEPVRLAGAVLVDPLVVRRGGAAHRPARFDGGVWRLSSGWFQIGDACVQ